MKHKKRTKARCNYRIALAIKQRKIERQVYCVICQSDKYVIAHHPDYTKPFKVLWICRTCHNKLHKNSNLLHKYDNFSIEYKIPLIKIKKRIKLEDYINAYNASISKSSFLDL